MENFISYTQTDPNFRITRTTRRVTWTDLTKNEDAYVYADKGGNYFSGNFVHYLTIQSTGHGGAVALTPRCSYWALTNLVDDYVGIADANGDGLFLWARVNGTLNKHYIRLQELDGGAFYTGTDYEIAVSTNYYLKIVRDESVGTYGTLYCYTYSDPARATLVDTQSITLHSSKKDYRYIYALQSINSGAAYTHSGITNNLELTTTSFEVTTQPVTSITATTATGNGIIVDLGIATVTAHGHCWDSTIDPTTTDSSSGFWGKTSNGEGSLGAFTSSMSSNIVAGQQYFVRAYITSTEGTVYGANVVFIATSETTSTQLIQGNLAIVQGRLQYIDASGVERYITGAAV